MSVYRVNTNSCSSRKTQRMCSNYLEKCVLEEIFDEKEVTDDLDEFYLQEEAIDVYSIDCYVLGQRTSLHFLTVLFTDWII